MSCPVDLAIGKSSADPKWAWGERAAILLLFILYAGQGAPAVNEAHYLAKARHYWQPNWCAGDLFLESADAHLVFYWTIGWLAAVMPLPAAAWTGRLLAWATLAWGWQRLSYTTVARRGLSVLTAALWLTLVDRTAMAGEWIVGGVEAKCFSLAMVLPGIEAMLRNQWRRTLLWLGAATSFHVLVGGWALVAAGAAWLSCGSFRPRWTTLVPAGIGAIVLALPGLLPAMKLTSGQDPVVVLEANWIYVFERLSHHLLFHRLATRDIVAHVTLVLVWIAIGWLTPCQMSTGRLGQRPLRGFAGGAVALAVIGAALDQLLLNQWDLAATFLKYYWFRLSDAFLPAAVALMSVSAAVRWRPVRPRLMTGALIALGLLATLHVGAESLRRGWFERRQVDPRIAQLVDLGLLERERLPQVQADWLTVTRWIDEHLPHDARFITPRNQQTFKWYAQRSEAVSVKDIPQDAKSVIAWADRRGELYSPDTGLDGVAGHGEERLVELAEKYDCQYIVADRFLSGRMLNLPRVYPERDDENRSFVVYRVRSHHPSR